MAAVPPINIPVTVGIQQSYYSGPNSNDHIPCPNSVGSFGRVECPHIEVGFGASSAKQRTLQTRVKCKARFGNIDDYKRHWMEDHWIPFREMADLRVGKKPTDSEPKFRRGDPDDQALTETYVLEEYEDDHQPDIQGFVLQDTLHREFQKQGTSGYPIVFRTPDMEEWIPHRIRTLQETKFTVIDLSLRER